MFTCLLFEFQSFLFLLFCISEVKSVHRFPLKRQFDRVVEKLSKLNFNLKLLEHEVRAASLHLSQRSSEINLSRVSVKTGEFKRQTLNQHRN